MNHESQHIYQLREQILQDTRKIRALEGQRDALLEALQSLVAVCENEGFPYLGKILPRARAVIALVTNN